MVPPPGLCVTGRKPERLLRRLLQAAVGMDRSEAGRRPTLIHFHGCGSFHRPLHRARAFRNPKAGPAPIPAIPSREDARGAPIRFRSELEWVHLNKGTKSVIAITVNLCCL